MPAVTRESKGQGAYGRAAKACHHAPLAAPPARPPAAVPVPCAGDLQPHHDRRVDRNFLAVLARPPAIDDEETRCLSDGQQGVVPGVGPVTDALITCSVKRVYSRCPRPVPVLGHDNEEGRRVQWIERLAGKGVSLEGLHAERDRSGRGPENTDQRPSLLGRHVDRGEVIVTLTGVFVDEARSPTGDLDDISKRGERCGGERCGLENEGCHAGVIRLVAFQTA